MLNTLARILSLASKKKQGCKNSSTDIMKFSKTMYMNYYNKNIYYFLNPPTICRGSYNLFYISCKQAIIIYIFFKETLVHIIGIKKIEADQ